MKLIILVLLFISSPAFASDWSKDDVTREAIILVIHTVDWGQTRTIAKNPNQWRERNAPMGDHPSVSDVNKHFVLTGLVRVGISHFLSPETRKYWQYASIVIGGTNIARNHHIGLRISF